MENKFQSILGGRVGKAHIETTRLDSNKKYLGNVFGLDMPLKEHLGLLDQRSSL